MWQVDHIYRPKDLNIVSAKTLGIRGYKADGLKEA